MKGSERYRSDTLNGCGQREAHGGVGVGTQQQQAGCAIFLNRREKARLSVQSTGICRKLPGVAVSRSVLTAVCVHLVRRVSFTSSGNSSSGSLTDLCVCI